MVDRASLRHSLRVRTRQVVDGTAVPSLSMGVLCPRRGCDVDLEECRDCPSFRQLRIDATGPAWTVTCELAEGSSEPGASIGPSTVGSIMTTDVLCVGPGLLIAELEALLAERGIGAAPVVDASGRPIGMVSRTDLVRQQRAERAGESRALTVAEIMTPAALCFPANEAISRAAAVMSFEGIHRIPVVDTRGRVVGVVSSLDVLRWVARRDGYVIAPERSACNPRVA